MKKIINNKKEWIKYVQEQNWHFVFKQLTFEGIEWINDSKAKVLDFAFQKRILPPGFILPRWIFYYKINFLVIIP